MYVPKRSQFFLVAVGGLALTLPLATALGTYSLVTFATAGVLWLLAASELTAGRFVTPPWRRRIHWVLALGAVVFAAVVATLVARAVPGGL